MKVYRNEITIHRGETFTMRKKVICEDGSPFVVSNQINNPRWLITVTNSKYEQENRYVLNKWLVCGPLKFYRSKPINIKEIPIQDGIAYYQNFETMPLPAGYEGDETEGYADIAVFYQELENGERIYRYWKYDNDEKNDFSGDWEVYNCYITTQFNNDITSKWSSSTYWYSITLMCGEINDEGVIIDSDLSIPILEPSKLLVQSNLRGGN